MSVRCHPTERTPLAHITTLAGLQAYLGDFTGCALKETAQQTVLGDGDATADIMLIGEAPGAREDALGKPFVGRSGQLLDQLLAEIGLSRDARRGPGALQPADCAPNCAPVYISNVMFWRPPGNRKPTRAELASVRPVVDKHIALINPKLIVLVGGVPAQELLRTQTGIAQLRGHWQELSVHGTVYPVLPIFHPAYVLRNPPMKQVVRADLQLLRQRGEAMGVQFGPMALVSLSTTAKEKS